VLGKEGALTQNPKSISLGFAPQEFPPGVHICQIFNDDVEREETLLSFLLSGLQSGERATCYSEKTPENVVAGFLGAHGISCSDARNSGALTLAGTREAYFQNDHFDPDRMLRLLRAYYVDSIKEGYPAARVIGEMTSEIQRVPGGTRLLEYESRISLLLQDHPITAVCQYDARSFEGAMIMDILTVHPMMVVRGSVVHNPFFIPPREFLSR